MTPGARKDKGLIVADIKVGIKSESVDIAPWSEFLQQGPDLVIGRDSQYNISRVIGEGVDSYAIDP
jgi:hypothetical protein